MATIKRPIQEAKRYIDNARTILSEKAEKEEDYYHDGKYVKMAGNITCYIIARLYKRLFAKEIYSVAGKLFSPGFVESEAFCCPQNAISIPINLHAGGILPAYAREFKPCRNVVRRVSTTKTKTV
jgi:hypothetical protein